ncbi:MAG: N-acetyltransferase [Candidatus Omnitrophica bacterium]|nr:N-acetyltransferase [Candidatus Omnitrophota bacterium]
MDEKQPDIKVHSTAIISDGAKIGKGTIIWAYVQVMDGAEIGENCMLGNGVFIDRGVRIGNNVKIHNKSSIYNGTIIEDNVFIGPHTCFINDKYPRHDTTRDLQGIFWRVGKDSSIGANVTVLSDVNVGSNVTIGAGSVVTKNVPNNSICYGNPAVARESGR